MGNLLDFAVDAHGGLERWDDIGSLKAEMSIAGAIWTYKGRPDIFSSVTVEAQTHNEHLTLTSFTGAGRKVVFEPLRVALEASDGEVLEERRHPRAAFSDHVADTQWDDLDAAYFCSCALWTYLTAPFLYTYPGFVTEELPPWHEDGEEWRRLKVTFPDGIATHTREQVSYFGSDGLLRRHDYTVDVLGGAKGANYASGYREFNGIKMPTSRRVYAYDGDGRKVAEPLLVAIDISAVSFASS